MTLLGTCLIIPILMCLTDLQCVNIEDKNLPPVKVKFTTEGRIDQEGFEGITFKVTDMGVLASFMVNDATFYGKAICSEVK